MKTKCVLAILLLPVLGLATVDMRNGNYSELWIDLRVPGSGYDLHVDRAYNSRSLYNGMFGFGWGSNFETSLVVTPEGFLKIYYYGDGRQDLFLPPGSSAAAVARLVDRVLESLNRAKKFASDEERKIKRAELLSDENTREQLARQYRIQGIVPDRVTYKAGGRGSDTIVKENDLYTLTYSDGEIRRFDLQGRLVKMLDKNGNYLDMRYEKARLLSVVDPDGRSLAFAYNDGRRVREIISSVGLKANFWYNERGDLVKTKSAWGNVYEYVYDDLHNLTKVIYPDKTTKELTYDKDKDWILRLKDRTGCIEEYAYFFSREGPRDRYWTTIEKKCEGKVTNLSRFEFWYQPRKDGTGQYLARYQAVQNADFTDTTYEETYGLPLTITKNGETVENTYFDNGSLKSRKSGDETQSFLYDSDCGKVSRVVIDRNKSGPDSAAEKQVAYEYQYDAKCNLVLALTSKGVTLKLEYDDRGRITSLEDGRRQRIIVRYEEKFGKPEYVTAVGIGTIKVSYKSDGEIAQIMSTDQNADVAIKVAQLFNSLLEIITPAGVKLGL